MSLKTLSHDASAIAVGMFALALGVAFIIATSAEAQTLPGRTRAVTGTTVCASTTCSGTAPTNGDATVGVSLQQGYALRYRLCAPTGQTLSGAGTLDVYVYDENDGIWALVPGLAKTVPTSASGKQCIGFEEAENGVPFGRVLLVPNAVTLSSTGILSIKHYVATK
jgi:hypothetical protein